MRTLKSFHLGQKGMVLPVVLILLMFGGLLAVPTLNLLSTNLIAGTMVENKTKGFFAADAGIKDAICKLADNPKVLLGQYQLEDSINGMTVNIEHALVPQIDGSTTTYWLRSIAKLNEVEQDRIVSEISVDNTLSPDYSLILDNSITSKTSLTIGNNATIDGTVQYNGTRDWKDNKVIIEELSTEPIASWPDAATLGGIYWNEVKDKTLIGSSVTGSVGPGYTSGNLTVNGTVTLNGTVYVKGNLYLPNQCILNLNGHTIFVEGSIPDYTNGNLLNGPGCVIALGSIYFKNTTESSSEYIVVLSINGGVDIKNSATFTGSIAGKTFVTIKNGADINYVSPDGLGLNFPIGATTTVIKLNHYSN